MFIFSHAAVQDHLNHLAAALAEDQLDMLARRLNALEPDRVAAMWEVMILSGLCSVGRLEHEKPLPDGKRPDFTLTLGGADRPFTIVGDIRTVSDKYSRRNNDTFHFMRELHRVGRRFKITPSEVKCDIRGRRIGPYGDSRTELKMPPKGEIAAFLKANVTPFFERVVRLGLYKDEIRIDDGGLEITIGYDKSRMFTGGCFASCTTAGSLEKNPLYNALHKKARQLRHAKAADFRLAILCDGGCDLLGLEHSVRTPESRTREEVVRHFLNTNNAIDGVQIVRVFTEILDPLNPLVYRRFHVRGELLIKSDAYIHAERIHKALTSALASLPPPIHTPFTVAHYVDGMGRIPAEDAPFIAPTRQGP